MKQEVLAAIKAFEKEMSGIDLDYQITETISLPQGATMYLFEGYGVYSSAIEYADGTIFLMSDWQGSRPTTFEEIKEFSWINLQGRLAVIFNGLPRTL